MVLKKRVSPKRTPDLSYVDLHIHSIYSDSSSTPHDILKAAQEKPLAAISLTDHDSAGGISSLVELAEGSGIEIIPGVELSVTDGKADIHILGYFIDYRDEWFVSQLAIFKLARLERAKKILLKLKELKIELDIESVLEIAEMGAVGRPHIAEALLRSGHVGTFEEAFHRYIGHNSPAYVPKLVLEPKEAFDLIKKVDGVSVLAHPGTMMRDDLIPEFVEQGLDGLEVWHPKHDRDTAKYYKEIAKRYDLVVTGGSDSHGLLAGGSEIGSGKVPFEIVEKLRERKRSPKSDSTRTV
ncbi:MAG: PHP domain-containing protein [Candidatus Eisenbacteria bacterium]|nr:PHP domain-containing protein [Candidatus Eisenbacteria bacterium]